MNNKTISLFNYVYSCMYEKDINDDDKWKTFEELCLEKMNYVPYDFIIENESLVTMNRKSMWQDITGNKGTVGKFVILNFLGTKEYLQYKINEVKTLIKNYGIEMFDNLDNIFENMCNEAIREILVESRSIDLIDFNDNIFRYADNRLSIILYNNIKVVVNKKVDNQTGNTIFITNSGQLVNQIGNGNTANISHINDEQLFTLLEEKIEAIKIEMKNRNCEDKLEELEIEITGKDKKSALEIISHLAGIGSFIASGIGMFLG